MSRSRLFAFLSITVLLGPLVLAAEDTPRPLTTLGVIEKVEKELVTIKHRAADGKFDKSLVLKLTGTSRLSVLSTQKRGDKLVLVQKDMEAKNLAEKQQIAVIFANNGDDHVLLAAVVQAE